MLGPLLFLAYFNDMPDCVTSQIKLFADDSLLYARISGEEDAVRLQENLNRLTELASGMVDVLTTRTAFY